MIEIFGGITIGPGITIGEVYATPLNFATENNLLDYFITESGTFLITEGP